MNNIPHRRSSEWENVSPHNGHGETDSLLGSGCTCHTVYDSTANPPHQPGRGGLRLGIASFWETLIASVPPTLQKREVIFWSSAFIFFVIGWGTRGAWSSIPDILNPADRDRIRSDWEKEYQHHQARIDRMEGIVAKWADEVEAHGAARLAMQTERAGWEVERKKWEKEHEEREKVLLAERKLELEKKRREEEREKEEEDKAKAGIKWAEPQPDPRCLRYGTRKWTAKLDNVPAGYNAILLCQQTKALIHGRWVLPDNCENKGAWAGTIGTWYVDFDEAACNTFWTPTRDKGCTAEGSGKRRIEAQIENLRPGDDWMAMCSSTPAEFHGLKFDGPHSCNDWGKWGYWGLWFIEDGDCK
ncbi:hypothetical protein BKA70DRAFT_1315721 [Coprinopsis sp. MPI-PUGE-AT-0042]|nr:hypothetical protein BKA70DRAFT_1315721 [Coprinopsis sp. MPI-PUGE-AT-0042]